MMKVDISEGAQEGNVGVYKEDIKGYEENKRGMVGTGAVRTEAP